MRGSQRVSNKGPSKSGVGVLLWILLLLAGIEFIVRGPVRCLEPTGWNDLAQYYAASRLWLRGQDFASPERFVALWRTEVHSTLDPNSVRTHIAPPPGALVFFAPIAVLPWPIAVVAWLIVLLLGFATTIWALMKTAGLHFGEHRGIAFATACLALAPFHTGIASANQTVIVIGLCAAGVYAAISQRDLLAGLSFGVACSLKPHIASFLVLYFLLRRRWRLFGSALGFTVVLAFVAILWMQVKGVGWEQNYFNNLRFEAARNKIDDFTADNPIRFMLINLQVLIYSFTRDARSSNLVAFSIGAMLLAVWAVMVFKPRANRSELLSLSAVGIIGLLPIYHRFYDAAILALPLSWCFSVGRSTQKKIAKAAVALIAPFFLPSTALLQQAVRRGYIPQSWTRSWWWDRVVMPHQIWLLVALCLILLSTMRDQTGSTLEKQPSEAEEACSQET